MKRILWFGAALLYCAAGGLFLAGVLSGQDKSASVSDGVYSEAQAARGQAVYAKMCASCHGTKLEGAGQNPPLAGDDFLANWKGMTVGDLFDQIQATMPADHPGTLTKPQNADVIAYILKSNHFDAGSAELTSDLEALKHIRFAGKQ